MNSEFFQKLIIQSLALLLVAYVLPGIEVTGVLALVVSAFFLGLVNAFIRPILLFFTFPITILTLGLFIFVVNGACFGLVAWLVKGFRVDGWFAAILGAIAMSLVSFFLNSVLVSKKE